MKIKLLNPRTGEVIGEEESLNDAEVEAKLALSQFAFEEWRKLSLAERMDRIRALADEMGRAREDLANLMHIEMGKSLTESLAEVDKCRFSCEVLSSRLPEWSKEYTHRDGGGTFHVVHEPLGVLLGVMPWNFPLWQVIRFAVPALGLGNTVLLKHAPNVWGFARKIEELFSHAGFLKGVYQNFPIDVPLVERVIADPRVRGASLTGSRRAGSSLAELCGRHIKKCVLELGGSDPYVVLEDADIELAARVCARSRLQNAGQSCVSAKRFIVHTKAAFDFTSAFGKALSELSKDLAPLAREDLRSLLHSQVERSLASGSRLTFGGTLPEGPGYFYPATMLTAVRPGHAAFDEELFGPVASVIVGHDEDELFQLANQSIYGLGGAIFSRDVDRAFNLARSRLDVGMCFVNEMVRSHVEVPFGGVKDSGVGRELGPMGSLEFSNVKLLFR